MTRSSGARAVALLLTMLAATVAMGQEIRETDLARDDAASLGRMLVEAAADADAGDNEAALARLASVLALCGDDPNSELRPLAARALVLRARVRLGDVSVARTDIEAALRLLPAVATETGDPRALREMLDDARRRLLGRLSVTSEPTGATVRLDGLALGTTPVLASPVVAGTHFLRVSRVGYATADIEAQVAPGKDLVVRVPLERRSATLLFLTDAEPTTLRWDDGTLLGVATRPDPETADELVRLFNLPIDPYEPSPMFLLQNAPVGRHEILAEAPCREPRRQVVEVPDGADSTSMISLTAVHGRLTVRGSADLRVRLDGAEETTLPLAVSGLCPGPHLLEAREPGGGRTRRTVWVDADAESAIDLEILPVLAWLGGDPSLARALGSARHMNSVAAEGLSAIDHAALISPLDAGARTRVDAMLTANQAVMCAWSAGEAPGSVVYLLAKGSPIADRLSLSPTAAASDLLAIINREPPPPLLDIGLTAIDTALFPHPMIAALAEGGPAQRAGLRVGDAVRTIDGIDIATAAELHARVQRAKPGELLELRVGRTAGDATISVAAESAIGEDSPAGWGMPPNLVIARTLDELSRSSADRALPRLRLRTGRAYLELGAWSEAQHELSAVPLQELPPPLRGRVLFDLGRAAANALDHEAARTAWRAALAHGEARAIAPDGPPITTVVPELLRRLDAAGRGEPNPFP